MRCVSGARRQPTSRVRPSPTSIQRRLLLRGRETAMRIGHHPRAGDLAGKEGGGPGGSRALPPLPQLGEDSPLREPRRPRSKGGWVRKAAGHPPRLGRPPSHGLRGGNMQDTRLTLPGAAGPQSPLLPPDSPPSKEAHFRRGSPCDLHPGSAALPSRAGDAARGWGGETNRPLHTREGQGAARAVHLGRLGGGDAMVREVGHGLRSPKNLPAPPAPPRAPGPSLRRPVTGRGGGGDERRGIGQAGAEGAGEPTPTCPGRDARRPRPPRKTPPARQGPAPRKKRSTRPRPARRRATRAGRRRACGHWRARAAAAAASATW